MIQKLEADVRMHIRSQHQMKITIENLKQKEIDLKNEIERVEEGQRETIAELKQDKKRYEELLEFKAAEVKRLETKLKENNCECRRRITMENEGRKGQSFLETQRVESEAN